MMAIRQSLVCSAPTPEKRRETQETPPPRLKPSPSSLAAPPLRTPPHHPVVTSSLHLPGAQPIPSGESICEFPCLPFPPHWVPTSACADTCSWKRKQETPTSQPTRTSNSLSFYSSFFKAMQSLQISKLNLNQMIIC